jgi:hypothetical protein
VFSIRKEIRIVFHYFSCEESSLSWNRGDLRGGGITAAKEENSADERLPRPSPIWLTPAAASNSACAEIIQNHVMLLARPESGTLFARVTEEFIRCAKESQVQDPRVLMRNMRQFMNGLKNYLLRQVNKKAHKISQHLKLCSQYDTFEKLLEVKQVLIIKFFM